MEPAEIAAAKNMVQLVIDAAHSNSPIDFDLYDTPADEITLADEIIETLIRAGLTIPEWWGYTGADDHNKEDN